MASSEAVMVAPEQCATAPKTLVSKQAEAPAAAKTSTTRVVLLAVLALAAATGAMFGVVVFGNEFTKDMHPKGGALVDSEDRAVATAAVESYVSLLDLPLLGTAELNKVDGITFSTYKGIEHRKVTGYTVTKETAVVGDSEVATPRLSLATSAPGVTVEVSVRDNKAWLSEAAAGKVATTAIDATSQRRLADGGSCLENGACLYSRDELLHLDAASRRLEEGSFFARADVAAYQVELDGDVMPYLERSAEGSAYLDGTWTEGAHKLRLRVAETPAGTEAFFTNYTSGKSKLLTKDGAYLYTADGRLYECHEAHMKNAIEAYTVDSLVDSMTFEAVEVSHGEAQADFIPFRPADKECFQMNSKLANLSTSEALQAYPTLAGAYQNKDVMAQANPFSAKSRRRLAKTAIVHAKRDKMTTAVNEKMNLLQKHPRRELGSGVSHFDLWIATRMADPTFIDYKGYVSDAFADDEFSDASYLSPAMAMNLGGLYGITKIFAQWSGFCYAGTPGCSARRRLAEEESVTEQRKLRGGPDECMFISKDMQMACDPRRGDARKCAHMKQMLMEMGCLKQPARKPVLRVDPEVAKAFHLENKIEETLSVDTRVVKFYDDEIATDYLIVPSKEVIENTDIADVNCGSYSSMDYCLGMEWAGCMWNEFYSCCSDPGMKCGSAASVDIMLDDVFAGVGTAAEKTKYTGAITQTDSFLTEIFPGSCPGGFLPTNPMMDAIKIGSVCKEVKKTSSFDSMCSGNDAATFKQMTEPNAWASLLVKSRKTVAAFQGTKMHDASMLDYSLKREAIYLQFGGNAAVVPEGFALYIAHLFNCIYVLDTSPDYITGHSLGGAAATIYSKISTSSSTVTFGAPATGAAGLYSSMITTPAVTRGFEVKTKQEINPVPANLPTFGCTGSSVRYFHKFDPVPGFYYSGGVWVHETTSSVLLWDEINDKCTKSPCSSGNAGVNSAIAAQSKTLTGYLCTDADIATAAETMNCNDGMNYFSYTNMVNPLPCAEIILSMAYDQYPSTTAVEVMPWKTKETFEGCAESYIGSISAYFGLYMTSDLVDLRGDELERDSLDVGLFYAAWGLMWIHSSYANYCLDGSSYGASLDISSGSVIGDLVEKAGAIYVGGDSVVSAEIIKEMTDIATQA